jgi:hypothetical protein
MNWRDFLGPALLILVQLIIIFSPLMFYLVLRKKNE